MKSVPKLTDKEWQTVFQLRCKSKRGHETLSKQEQTLIERAYAENEDRVADMEVDVFNATVPPGSSAYRQKT